MLSLQTTFSEGAKEAMDFECSSDGRHCYLASHNGKLRAYSRKVSGNLDKIQTVTLADGVSHHASKCFCPTTSEV